jgi:hypothetical protein
MKTKFKNIKGMLQREEMKQVVGGDPYNGRNKAGGPVLPAAPGTALGGALNSTNGLSINYGNGGNYSNSYNYGGGMNGSAASGSPANTYSNGGNTSAPKPTSGYGQP